MGSRMMAGAFRTRGGWCCWQGLRDGIVLAGIRAGIVIIEFFLSFCGRVCMFVWRLFVVGPDRRIWPRS